LPPPQQGETGMRVGEALGVYAEHVFCNDVDGGFIRVFGKGHMEQQVVINFSGFRAPAPADRAQGNAAPNKP